MKVERVGWRPPKFFTTAWVSPSAKAHWEPLFSRLTEFWTEMEVLSVSSEVRPCALSAVPPSLLDKFCYKVKGRNLVFQPFGYDSGFVRVAVAKDHDTISKFYQAWLSRNDELISQFLGYPKCCSEWFKELWDSGKRDTCLAMDTGPSYNPRCNILLRDWGIRPVFHLPCSFHCAATINLASELIQVAHNIGSSQEIQAIYDILQWPVLYTSLHGIAEITTPVAKIRRDTDPEDEKKIVTYLGEKYPQHGASGVKFPFRKHNVVPVSFVKNNWSDNGFATGLGMEKGHGWLVSIIRDYELDRTQSLRVVDFGCGNGELLRRIKEVYPNIIPHGFDFSTEKVQRARTLVPGAHIEVADVTKLALDQMAPFDLGIISIHRIEEANCSGVERFQDSLETACKRLLIYNYDDWKSQMKIA